MRARLAFLALLATAIPAAVSADDYDEFRVPDHSTRYWALTFQGSAGRYVNNHPSDWSRDASGFGGLETYYARAFDGEMRYARMTTRVGLHESVASSRSRAQSSSSLNYTELNSRRWDLSASQNWALYLDERRWFGRSPVAVSARVSGSGVYAQSRTNHETPEIFRNSGGTTRIVDETEGRAFRTEHSVSGSVGAGVGRVRDVTGMHATRVIEARLRQSGAITRELSAGARQRLAAIVYLASAVDRVEDRPAQVVWRAIEDVLREDGALAPSGLSGAAAFGAAEPFARSGGPDAFGLPTMLLYRSRGQWIGLALGGEHFREILQGDERRYRATFVNDLLTFESRSNVSRRSDSPLDYASIVLDAEWHRPVGDDWQWDAWANYQHSLRVRSPLRSISESVRANRLVFDRGVLTVGLDHWRAEANTGDDQPVGRSQWRVGLLAQATWYVQNQLSLNVTASDFQGRNRRWDESGFPEVKSYDRFSGISAGLTWRFQGSMTAPGFPILEAAGARVDAH